MLNYIPDDGCGESRLRGVLKKAIAELSSSDCALLTLLLSLATVTAVRRRLLTTLDAENVVFNLDVLTACEERLGKHEVVELLEAGMELDDVLRHVSDAALDRACDDVLEGIGNAIARLHSSGSTDACHSV